MWKQTKYMEAVQDPAPKEVISAEQLLEHWQGHRRLTRKMIEAFPEEHFFTYSIGGMRPFGMLVMEMIDLTEGGVAGAATGKWKAMSEWRHVSGNVPGTKEGVLQVWDEVTEQINVIWPQITPERFQEVDKAFGMYEAANYDSILYFIDNEIHHRGQAYVYLRSLGVEPPSFWDRG